MEESGGPRDPNDPFWIAGALIVTPWVVWWLWAAELVRWLAQVKLLELRALEALGFGSPWTRELERAFHGALAAPDRISFEALLFGLEAVGVYLRGPVAVVLLLLGGWLLLGHPAHRYRRRHDLAGLAEATKAQWPFALHALRRGQLAIPLDHPVWGVALTGAAFLRQHDLVTPHDPGTAAARWSLCESRARTVLAAQLGGASSASPTAPARALAGIFALRIASYAESDERLAAKQKEQVYTLLKRLALVAATNGKGDYLPPSDAYARVIRKTEPFLHVPAVSELRSQHAYSVTVLLRLLAEARGAGVLPCALFTWLKGVDRPLWYALSSLGRRTPFVEALGAIAHYQAECAAGVALPTPVLDAALDSLHLDAQRLPPPP